MSGRVIQMTDSLFTLEQNDHTVDISYSDIIAIDRPKDCLGKLAAIVAGREPLLA